MLGIVGLVCSVGGVLGLLAIAVTLGFFFFIGFVSLPLSIAGMVCGQLGRQRVDRGELPGGRGISQAAFVTGLVAVILHVLAALVLAVLFGLLLSAIDDVDVPAPDGQEKFDGPARALLGACPGLALAWLERPFGRPARRSSARRGSAILDRP